MRTSNPMFDDARFAGAARSGVALDSATSGGFAPPSATGWGAPPPTIASDRMTLGGTLGAGSLLLAFVAVTAAWSWSLVDVTTSTDVAGRTVTSVDMPTWVGGMMIGSMIVALVAAITSSFKPQWSKLLGPVYALAEGVVLGTVSHLFDAQYPGIVAQAILGTIATAAAVLLLYRLRIVRATPKFRRITMIALFGAMLTYLGSFVIGLFSDGPSPLSTGGPLGILISLAFIVIASMSLVLDFDLIETGIERGYPKDMEWYSALGLMITLVWLYMEMLRLLSRLRD